MKSGYYIVGGINKQNNFASIASNPVLHSSVGEARAEAERLAKIYHEKKFVVLKVDGIVSISDVVWE